MQYRRQMKETGEIDFGNILLYWTLICLATHTLPLYEFFKSWKSVMIKRKKKSHVSAWLVNLRNNYLELFLVLKTIFLDSFKILRKLSITKSDNSNIASAAPLKSLSVVDILLPILQQFRIFFWKTTSERLLRQLVPVSM